MAIEKIISIVSSELKTGKSGKQYLDVVDQDNTRFSCWDESLWNNLGKNANAKIEFEQKGIFKNIVIVEPMAEAIKNIPTPPIQPAPQEIGMWWKEIGEMIRAGHIKKKKADGTPNPEGALLIRAYYAQMFSVLNISIKDKGSLTTE